MTFFKKIMQTLLLIAIALILPILLLDSKLLIRPEMLIAIFAAFTLNMSQPVFKTTESIKRTQSDQYSLLALLFAGIGIFTVPIIDWGYIAKNYLNLNHLTIIFGSILASFGLLFRYYSIKYLGKFFTARVEIVENHQIIQTGPYKLIRHPSYTGALILALGLSVVFSSWIGLVFCIFIFFPVYIYRISCEEKTLLNHFGSSYLEYQKKTYKLFPGIY